MRNLTIWYAAGMIATAMCLAPAIGTDKREALGSVSLVVLWPITAYVGARVAWDSDQTAVD